MNLRSDVNTVFFGSSYVQEHEFISRTKLQTGQFILGRMLYLCRKEMGYNTVSKEQASEIVAKELIADWVDKNVYPASEHTVARKLSQDYETFRQLRKEENRTDRPKSKGWLEKAERFHCRMVERAYDIRCENKKAESDLAMKYGVKMTVEDEQFYVDNCQGDYVAICTRTVPKKWLKQVERKQMRQQSIEKKKSEKKCDIDEQEKLREIFLRSALIDDDTYVESDAMYGEPKNTTTTEDSSPPITRFGWHEEMSERDTTKSGFPLLNIRTGRKTFHEPLMRALVQCLADTKVTPNDLIKITTRLANIVFEQKWKIASDDDEDETEYYNNTEQDVPTDFQGTRKRKTKSVDLSNVMPSRRTLNQYLEDASYINLERLADVLIRKGDKVVTLGLDDTSKAAGHRKIDVKTTHFTVIDQNRKRETYTTGYTENISHRGKDGAIAVEFELKRLATLGKVSENEIADMIDFVMTDRAADCNVLLNELNLSAEVLKCSAHIVLGLDHGIEKVFKDTEARIGIEKLINCGEILRSSSSLFTIGLIAITKLLSPSHANKSVSLYNEFVLWCPENGVDVKGFRGFVSNRIGRICELAKTYLKLQDAIKSFFDAVVDKHSNKLVLAVSTFIYNDWFNCCAEVYSLVGEIIIFPILDLLGIDGRGSRTTQTWNTLKEFFKSKLQELKRLRIDFSRTNTGKGKLIGEVISELVETVERQLSSMDFFEIKGPAPTPSPKMDFTPLTNLGCESRFASLTNRINTSGGMATVRLHSMKSVVATNRFLLDAEFVETDDDQKRETWKRGRNSDELKAAKQLERDFLATVLVAKTLSLKQKEDMKRRKQVKLFEILDSCKKHGGPVSVSTTGVLDKLTEKQMLLEISYLRQTIAPDIRQKRKVTVNGQGRFQKFTKSELKSSMSVVKPEYVISDDIDELLKLALTGKL